MTCDFVGPGRAGDILECCVRITRQTRTLVFLSADITAAGRAIAVATGLWKIV
jgi:acyl-coenzyme A thioesterase PaaI-like protein